jgi:hypothetical protein
MSRRIASWLAWSLFALTLALGLGTLTLMVALTRAAAAPGTPVPPAVAAGLRLSGLGWLQVVFYLAMLCAFAALGAVLVARQSRDPAPALGWLFCALGVVGGVRYFTEYYAVYTLFVAPDVLPAGLAAGWVQHWAWLVVVMFFVAFVPLRFPTGRLVSARWRPAWWLAVGATAAETLLLAFAPIPLGNFLDGADIPNPLGIAGLAAVGPAFIVQVLLLLAIQASFLLAAASLLVRLRRARGVERQQIKWFAYSAILLGLLEVAQAIVQEVLGVSSPALDLAWTLSFFVAIIGLPIATGLAILRYRLFDIDLIIRRTLVYGTLSAILVGLYFGVVVGLQALMGKVNSIAASSPVIIVGTTLLVAALSNPLRHGIQVTIDRRFYRRKYDAAKTLAAFGATLRSEVELAEVSAHLLTVVNETMQPAHVSLWLRPPARQAEPSHELPRRVPPLLSSSGVFAKPVQPEIPSDGVSL